MSKDKLPVDQDLAKFIIKEVKEKEFERKNIVQRLRYVYQNSTLSLEIFNSITHGIGALIAIAQLVLLIVRAVILKTGPLAITSVSLFGALSVLLFTMSCLYHAFLPGTTRNVFQRFDHISIYLLIAGTYTPFALLGVGGTLGWVIFGIQWGLALIGVVFKSVWFHRYKAIHLLLYLLMGWSIMFFYPAPIILYETIGQWGFLFVLFGGLSYSIGAIFYALPITRFNHAIWHFFVIFGNILHFISLFFYVLPSI